jgi:hypothetical protein
LPLGTLVGGGGVGTMPPCSIGRPKTVRKPS